MSRFALFLCLLCATLTSGHAQTGTLAVPQQNATPSPIQFLDLAKFDTLLSQRLKSSEPTVEVVFYDRVSPNQLPMRIQKWLTAVDQSGGSIDVIQPPGDLAPRNPALLLGLLGGLMSTLKAMGEIREEQLLQASAGHGVTFKLDKTPQGAIFIERLVFNRNAGKT